MGVYRACLDQATCRKPQMTSCIVLAVTLGGSGHEDLHLAQKEQAQRG